MGFWQRLGLGARISILAGLAMVLLVALLLLGYAYKERQSVVRGEVNAARGLVLMAESVREQVADKWEMGVYSTEKLRRWARRADSEEEKEQRILDAVPVYNAWAAAQAKAEEGGFRFKPLRSDPRDEEHAPNTVERKAIEYFRDNPGQDEYYLVDEEINAVRYFRPIHLDQICLNCHGAPSRSQELWGRSDGRDLLGYKMEGWDEGDLTGAFEVIRPLEAADATIAANLWQAIGTALLVLAAAIGLLLWLVQRGIVRPIHLTVGRIQEVDRGDLTVRSEEAGIREMTTLGGTFNNFLDNLNRIFRDWRAQSGQLASASEELSATADQISQNANASNQRVEQVATSAQEVNNVVQDVANNINEVSDSTSRSTATTQEGMKAVRNAADRIQQLKSSGERVDEIMSTIEAIAKKTDLLALNAAIEAANAGEAGQGFAVVADEVRKLAEQTSDATNQVSEVVAEVRSQSDASVQAMDEVQTKMGQVLEMIEHTDQNANQIAAAAEELAATMSETTDNMGEVTSNVEQVASSVSQIESSAQQLGHLALDLQQALGRFRLEEEEDEAGPSSGE